MNSRSDTPELIIRVQGGDSAALEILFGRYLPRVRKIVRLRMGEALCAVHDQEDVVQSAFVRVVRSLDSFEDLPEGSFYNWVARCVENEIIDMTRLASAQKRTAADVLSGKEAEILLSAVIDANQPDPSDVASARELEKRIEQELLELKAHYRELIILRHLCGMNYKELATELGFVSEKSARNAVSRAVGKLKERIVDVR